MKNFIINDRISIVCEYVNKRNGFKHNAILFVDGVEVERTKQCYLNRTWEHYEYQSVISKLLDTSKVLTETEKETIKNFLDGTDGYDGEGDRDSKSAFNTIAFVADIGDILYNGDQKAQNDWKIRMLKTGIGNELDIPKDWNKLTENEKKERLNKAIKNLKDKRTELDNIKKRLNYLRKEIKAERISYAEIAELQSLSDYIDNNDVLLLEWAGVSETEYNKRRQNKNNK